MQKNNKYKRVIVTSFFEKKNIYIGGETFKIKYCQILIINPVRDICDSVEHVYNTIPATCQIHTQYLWCNLIFTKCLIVR